MYYLPAKFGGDIPHTHARTHTHTHMYTADKRPTSSCDNVGVSKNSGNVQVMKTVVYNSIVQKTSNI